MNFPEVSTFSSISSLHQRNRDRHDHHDGTATVEHCHLWAVQLRRRWYWIQGWKFRGICTGNEEGVRAKESSLFVTFNYFQFSRK